AATRAPHRLFVASPTVLRNRRDRVLEAMVKDGGASHAEARVAMTRPTRPAERATAPAPWFMELVRGEVADRGGAALGGVQLVTSLDRRLQEAAEAAVRERLAQAERSRRQPANSLQAAVVAIEPASGQIRALVDSLNVPAALVAQGVGLPYVTKVARAVGVTSSLAPVPSLALGTSEVTLLEMTTAFATIANGGVRVWPTTLGSAGAVSLKP